MTSARRFASVSLVALTVALGAAILAPLPAYADAPLSGAITSATGERLGGVTVSAKAEGSPITTSVYTDASGNYYFPPLPEGNYRVWAQAVQFERATGNVAVGPSRQQNFVLKPITDREAWIRQLPGDEFLAALPGDTPEDFRMKTQVRKNCTGCHSASYVLQHRFDEEGWYKIMDLMKQVNVNGTYPRPDKRTTPNIDFHQRDLAKYLARARGPGESSMKFNLLPRPTGEAARIVVKEYDFPTEDNHVQTNDGSDWSLGTASESGHMAGVHDAAGDLDGNIWIVYSRPSRVTSYARIDAKTGAVKHFTLPDRRGIVAGSHGIVRDENGFLWFNIRSHVERRHGGLAKLDPRTEKLDIYVPPTTMSGTSGTIDADMKGHIWVTSPDGALHFNIKEERFTEYKSVTHKNKHGIATVYGLAADSAGNAWWLLMTQDLVNYSDMSTGKSHEFKLPPEQAVVENLTPDQAKLYETFVPPDFNTPFAWAQGARRMGADKNGPHVWIGNSFGGNLARVDINTKQVTLVPFPNPEAHQPYQVSVDKNHNVWTHLWSTDKVAKYNPATSQWTLFDLPNRGTESRHLSLLEREGQPMQVIVPYYRTRKVAVITPRSEADLEALRTQASRP